MITQTFQQRCVRPLSDWQLWEIHSRGHTGVGGLLQWEDEKQTENSSFEDFTNANTQRASLYSFESAIFSRPLLVVSSVALQQEGSGWEFWSG